MGPYVIRNDDTGKYAAWPGMDRSYTARNEDMQTFSNREDAERNACGNETVVSVLSMFA